jgi:DNA-binding transcriptional regulator GbsR (MarR family)
MSQTQSILITATATAVSMAGGYTITKLSKHIKKVCREIDEAIETNKKLQQQIDEMKSLTAVHTHMIQEIEEALEGVAYSIPYNNSRAWQTKIVQKKIAVEMAKLDENGEPIECDSDSE